MGFWNKTFPFQKSGCDMGQSGLGIREMQTVGAIHMPAPWLTTPNDRYR